MLTGTGPSARHGEGLVAEGLSPSVFDAEDDEKDDSDAITEDLHALVAVGHEHEHGHEQGHATDWMWAHDWQPRGDTIRFDKESLRNQLSERRGMREAGSTTTYAVDSRMYEGCHIPISRMQPNTLRCIRSRPANRVHP